MAARLTVTGTKEFQANLKKAAAEKLEKTVRALFKFGSMVMDRSQQNHVPTHLHVLQNSGRVQLPKVTAKQAYVDLTYGGAAIPYAWAIHEHPSKSSPPSWKAAEAHGKPVQFHPPGRGPKYLERPLMASTGELSPFLAAELAS